MYLRLLAIVLILTVANDAASAQHLRETSVFKNNIDSTIKAIFASGRKAMTEVNYSWDRDSFKVVSENITKYYVRNDTFIVHSKYPIPNWKFSDTESFSINYYDSLFRRVRSDNFSKMPRDRYGRYIRDDYVYDVKGRIKQQITYSSRNTIANITENEYHDDEGYVIRRGYGVPYELKFYSKILYDNTGKYQVMYSGIDSTENWIDTTDFRNSIWREPIPDYILNRVKNIQDIVPIYDSKGRLAKVLFPRYKDATESTINYIYDENGKLLEMNSISSPTDTLCQELSFYDDRGNLRQQKINMTLITLPSDPVKITKVKQSRTYTYDEMNRLLSDEEFDGLNERPNIKLYKYDARGNVVESKMMWGTKPESMIRYTYEY